MSASDHCKHRVIDRRSRHHAFDPLHGGKIQCYGVPDTFGRHVRVKAFYALLREKIGLGDDPLSANGYNPDTWPALRESCYKLQAAGQKRSASIL